MGNTKDVTRIDFAHHEIHDGDSFMAYNDELTMATTETINFAFKTPPSTTKQIHMVIEYETLVGGFLEILEAATWTAQTGTAFVPLNRNRNSTNTSELDRAPGAQNKAANVPRSISEIVLLADTTYVIRFSAIGNSNSGFIRLSWYEHLPNII